MCGRFTLRASSETIIRQFELTTLPDLTPRYNIAPSQFILCVRDSTREAALLRWGLIPSWADDPKIGNRMINARGETVAEKPAFRAAFRRRRCLIVADGYYEWQATGRQKQPYLIELADEQPFAIAGLWESWSAPDGTQIDSCTLITTEANSLTRSVHDRMPVIVAPLDYSTWLNPHSDSPALLNLIRGFSPAEMKLRPVSRLVNSPTHDSPDCIATLAD